MKNLFISLLLLTNIYAYDKGDTISDSMAFYIGCNKDKVYVIDFFASWCGSCKKEIPLLSKLNSKIDKTKFEIIGIDVDKKVEYGLKFQKNLKADGKLNFRVINDPQNSVISEFSPIGMPTLYFIKNKKVVYIITGAVDEIDEVVFKKLQELD